MVSVSLLASPLAPVASLRILVVEDDDDSRKLMAMSLDANGTHSVTRAKTAEEGLDRLRSDTFDLVVTDIALRNMQGLEMLDAANAEGLLAHATVVVCTASEGVRASVTRRGAILLPKPVDVNALADVLRRVEQGR